jgi:hypothetical protein
MKDNFNKYKRELVRDEIDIFEKVAGELLCEYGYILENPSNNQIHTFTVEEIKEFDRINNKRKEEVLKKAGKEDLQKRYKQEQFLREILREKGIVKTI